MLIVADENIPEAEAAFSRFGEVRKLSGRHIVAADVRDADILLVRSVTRVNESLLADSRVRFVGSATIGTDHVDQEWLASQKITFANAPGCNAISAAEYVMSALFVLEQMHGLDLQAMTLGIIGCGNVGSRVKIRAQALGIDCLVCDPPRADVEGHEGFVDMASIAQCDIVSLHVPLITAGRHPTWQLINQEFLDQMKTDAIFINTSRGDAVDEAAMLRRSLLKPGFKLVLDVWENEPAIDSRLVARTAIATPHIAGYSVDGKIRATVLLYEALCDFLAEPKGVMDWSNMSPPQQVDIELEGSADLLKVVRQSLMHVYDVRQDNDRLRDTMTLPDKERMAAFDRLRKHYWPRRECLAYRVLCSDLSKESRAALESFGFRL